MRLLRWVLIQNDWRLYKKEKCEDTQGKKDGHMMSDVSTRQGTPRTPSKHHTLQEARKNSPLKQSEIACPCQHLNFGFLASRTETINFCCFKLPSLGHFVTAALRSQYNTSNTIWTQLPITLYPQICT